MNNAELSAKITELENSVNEEQQEVANALAALEATVAELRATIEASGTPDQLQAHADAIDAIIADVKETIPGLPEPEEPVEPPV